jgi:hypothetical protein
MSAFAQELDANQPQDDEVAVITTNNGDECCENAREMYFQHLDERIDTEDFSGDKEWFKEYIRDPRSGSPALRDCEGLRQHLESLVAGRGPNSDKLQQILDEWDACADAKISSGSNVLFEKAWGLVKTIDPMDPNYGEFMAKNMVIDSNLLEHTWLDPQDYHDRIHSMSTDEFMESLHKYADEGREGCKPGGYDLNDVDSEARCTCDEPMLKESFPEHIESGRCIWDTGGNSIYRAHHRNMLALHNWNKWNEDQEHVWPQLAGWKRE